MSSGSAAIERLSKVPEDQYCCLSCLLVWYKTWSLSVARCRGTARWDCVLVFCVVGTLCSYTLLDLES
jgi:hypothetical protein